MLREFSAYKAGYQWELEWNWQQDFIYAEGQLVGGESPEFAAPFNETTVFGGVRHYHLDHIGSVRMVTNAAKRSTTENDYYPFGIGATATNQEFAMLADFQIDEMRFAGHQRDFAGLLNTENRDYLDSMHARYYDPNVGRFLSVDPVMDIERALKTPQLWNRYAYALNNPINRIDPDGKTDACPTCKTEAEEEAVRRAAAGGDEWAMMRLGQDPPGLIDKGLGPFDFLAFGLAAGAVRSGSRTAAQTLFEGGAKADVLHALRGGAGQMTSAQRTTLLRHVQRATTKETVTVTRNANGTLTVLKTRPGADGAQTIVTQIGRDGASKVVQTAQNAAGRLVHYDPKSNPSLLDRVKSWFY
jgi:RHS repeat-associated protein